MNSFAIIPYELLAKIKAQLSMSNTIITELNLDLVDNHLINVHEREITKNSDLIDRLCEFRPQYFNNN